MTLDLAAWQNLAFVSAMNEFGVKKKKEKENPDKLRVNLSLFAQTVM